MSEPAQPVVVPAEFKPAILVAIMAARDLMGVVYRMLSPQHLVAAQRVTETGGTVALEFAVDGRTGDYIVSFCAIELEGMRRVIGELTRLPRNTFE